MAESTDPDLVDAHRRSIRHREAIAQAERCGCFHCLAQLDPSEIRRWIDGGVTALCPRCGVDAVLAIEPGIDEAFLRRMQARWFGARG